MAAIIYDGNAIIPGPFASIRKENAVGDDGTILSSAYSIILKGKLVPHKGSPNSDGTFWTSSGYPPDTSVVADSRLGAILRKQEALMRLFATEGKTLEITPYDGSTPLSCNPRVKGIDFAEGLWFEFCDYTITLEADWINGLGFEDNPPSNKIAKASEEWNIEILDDKLGTYRLTHAVSAIGKRIYDETGGLLDGKEAWQNAEDYVIQTIGLGINPTRMEAPDVLDATTLQAFNYIRSNSVGERAGTYSVNESWVCFNPNGQAPAVHDYTVNIRTNANDNKTTVSVDGNITGLEKRNTSTMALISTKWANANSKWVNNVQPNVFSVAEAAAEIDLNPTALNTQLSVNEQAGTIQYTFEYDNRASAEIDGAITESISVSNSNASDVYALIPVLGRPYGPVMQSMGTVTPKRRTINIEALMPGRTQSYTPSAAPDTDSIVLGLAPISVLGSFMDNDEETWNPYTGRYTRSTSFTWE